MFDLIWEMSAASAAQRKIFLREATVPSKMVENSKFGERYEQKIISGAYKNRILINAIVKLTTQNKRIDAESFVNINTYKVEKQQII